MQFRTMRGGVLTLRRRKVPGYSVYQREVISKELGRVQNGERSMKRIKFEQ